MKVYGSETSKSAALGTYLTVAILAGLGLVGKAPLLGRLGHLPLGAALFVAACAPLGPLLWKPGWRYRKSLSVAAGLLLLGVFLTVLRSGVLHKMGRGSDQGDCVVVAAQQMAHGLWPYVSSKMVTRNAMSCGPGWVALQVPVIRLGGYFLDQIVLWALALVVMFRCLPSSVGAAMLSFIALSAGTWLSAADGNDFLPFGLLLAMVLVVAVSWEDAPVPPARRICLGVLLVCLAQFRIPTIFLPLLLVRPLGRWMAGLTFVAAVACQAAFLLWNTKSFVVQGPMHVGMKLFRTGLGQSRPTLFAEFLIPVVMGAVCVWFIAQRIRNVTQLVLAYLGLLFLLPAAQNLLLQYENKGSLIGALGYWEGGNWIVGLLPLAAVQLASVLQKEKPGAVQDQAASARIEPGVLASPVS